jgi:hypothetical protein
MRGLKIKGVEINFLNCNKYYGDFLEGLLVIFVEIIYEIEFIPNTLLFLHQDYKSNSRSLKYNFKRFFDNYTMLSLSYFTVLHSDLIEYMFSIAIKTLKFRKLKKLLFQIKKIKNQHINLSNDLIFRCF